MRGIVGVTFGLAAAYAGYWFWGQQERQAQVADIEAALGAVMDVEYDAIRTRGFPSRFDTRVDGLRLTREAGMLTLPALEVAALSYRPRNLIITFPDRFTYQTLTETYEITSDSLRAQVVVGEVGVAQVTVEADGFAIDGLYTADRIVAALRPGSEAYLDVQGGVLPISYRSFAIDRLTVDAAQTVARTEADAGAGPIDFTLRSATGRVDGTPFEVKGSTGQGMQVTADDMAALEPILTALGLPADGQIEPISLFLVWRDVPVDGQ